MATQGNSPTEPTESNPARTPATAAEDSKKKEEDGEWSCVVTATSALELMRLVDTAQSIASEGSTLCESQATSKDSPKSDAKKAVKLDDSARTFAKKAKEEGWGYPTASRPSLGGI